MFEIYYIELETKIKCVSKISARNLIDAINIITEEGNKVYKAVCLYTTNRLDQF